MTRARQPIRPPHPKEPKNRNCYRGPGNVTMDESERTYDQFAITARGLLCRPYFFSFALRASTRAGLCFFDLGCGH